MLVHWGFVFIVKKTPFGVMNQKRSIERSTVLKALVDILGLVVQVAVIDANV